MKGVTCDTGLPDVTFCPLMDDDSNEEEHRAEEAEVLEPTPTPDETHEAPEEEKRRLANVED